MQRQGEQVFICNAPDILVMHICRFDGRSVDNGIAIVVEEGLHIVEIAVTAIDVLRGIAIGAEYAAEGKHISIVWPLYDALSRCGRYRKGQCFKAPDCPGTG